MTLRMAKYTGSLRHPPAFGVTCPIVKPRQTCIGDRSRTHRARLKRHIQPSPLKPLLPEGRAGSADHKHFGMGRRVIQLAAAVARLRYNCTVQHYTSAHRHFATRPCRFSLSQGHIHMRIKHHISTCPMKALFRKSRECSKRAL